MFRTRPGSVIRKGKWKLHHYFEDGDYELYNLEDDPGEKNNLAHSQIEIRTQLAEMLTGWRKEVNAPVPDQPNPLYDRDFEMNLKKQKLDE